jgi:hypothetical protein
MARLVERSPTLRDAFVAWDDEHDAVSSFELLLDHFGVADAVDLQLRSAFPKWVAALRRQQLRRMPGSFGQRAS